MGGAGESGGGKMETTVFEQQQKEICKSKKPPKTNKKAKCQPYDLIFNKENSKPVYMNIDKC